MPSRLKDLRLRFPYDDQDFREKYTPGHVSPSSLKYTGDESKGPRAANASLKNNHPVFIFPHHDSDGSQNLFLCKEKNVSFHTFYRTSFYRQTLALPSREHPLKPAYLCSLGFRIDHPLDYQVDSEGGWVMPVVQVPGSGRRRSWSRLCGSLWFVCAGVERASREGSSYIYTSSTLTSR